MAGVLLWSTGALLWSTGVLLWSNMLLCGALCSYVEQYAAMWSNMLLCKAICCCVERYAAMWSIMLLCGALCCYALFILLFKQTLININFVIPFASVNFTDTSEKRQKISVL